LNKYYHATVENRAYYSNKGILLTQHKIIRTIKQMETKYSECCSVMSLIYIQIKPNTTQQQNKWADSLTICNVNVENLQS
jgi:hypothetical protein